MSENKGPAGKGVEGLPQDLVPTELVSLGVSLLCSFDRRFETEEDFVRRFVVEILKCPALLRDARIGFSSPDS
jgi:hypothetical protein